MLWFLLSDLLSEAFYQLSERADYLGRVKTWSESQSAHSAFSRVWQKALKNILSPICFVLCRRCRSDSRPTHSIVRYCVNTSGLVWIGLVWFGLGLDWIGLVWYYLPWHTTSCDRMPPLATACCRSIQDLLSVGFLPQKAGRNFCFAL